MKFKKILMLGYADTDLGAEHWRRIDSLCQEKVRLPKDGPEIQKHLATCDCLLLKLGMSADKDTIDRASNLKYIGIFGTGVGRIEMKYAAKKGIAVCNIGGYYVEAVAELTFALILEHLRDVARANAQARMGNFDESSYFYTSEIRGKMFGVIGLGHVGGRVVEIAKDGFDADIRYWSRNRKQKYEAKGIKYQTIATLLKECDFISLNLACVKGETENFLNAERLSQVKSGAIIINLAPIDLVDTNALENRLKVGDITYIMDHSDDLSAEDAKRLASYGNCIIYPPIGYTTKESSLLKKEMFVENLENFLKGKPTNKVN